MRRHHHHLTLAAAKSHAALLKSGISSPTPWNQLLTAYSACGSGLAAARRVFDEIPLPDAVSWNSLLAAHVAAGAHPDAWRLVRAMHSQGLTARTFALGSALRSAAAVRRPALAAQLQSFAVKSGLADNVIPASALLDVYAKCGRMSDARRLFDGMPERNNVAWNALMAGYAESGSLAQVMALFIEMEREGLVPDEATFAALLVAVEGPSWCFLMQELHGKSVKYGSALGLVVANAAITAYSQCGALAESRRIFDGIENRDLISWNSMLGAYAYHGMDDEAMRFFVRMMQESGVRPDIGMLGDARKSFEEADKSSSVPWNSMMFGYAQHGQAQIVTNLFNEMLELKVPLDHVTFVGLITAYSHAGLVDEGSEILNTMETRYQIPLRMEHYACGVDLYGRAGQLNKAKELIESMPFRPDAMVWMTLLGACKIHGNMELATDVASHLLLEEPRQHSTYVLLSSMYSGLGMWSDRATVQKVMKNRGVSKVPGWSWIEVKNEVHSFNAEDRSHPRMDEIYEMLRMLLQVSQKLCSSEDEEILEAISSDT
nr:unnamed protein product [Digitaria exilis]